MFFILCMLKESQMSTAIVKALRHLEIPLSQIKCTGINLGDGSYGKVFEVDYNGKLCAAKEVHSILLQLGDSKGVFTLKVNFLRECFLWSKLRHPNIVQFLGIYYPSYDQAKLPVMVLEKLQYSVTALIAKHGNIPLLVKLSILHDVSLGLRYLHDHDPVILHRDLSPNNILVTSHLEAKITDLGVSKVMNTNNDTSKALTSTPGTFVFMPPESLGDNPLYGPPLDIFSFGGVILYVTSRQWPTPKSWSAIDPKTKKRVLLSEIERRQQYIDMMIGSDTELKPLMMSCLDDDPQLRPSVTVICERLMMMKEVCSKRTTRDGMDPISWLSEIKQASVSTQLQVF